MTDTPTDSVLAALGIDPDGDTDIPIVDDVWQAMLSVAFDPATPEADPSIVPTMDDDGDVADDQPDQPHHDDHHPAAAGDDHHPDDGADGHAPDGAHDSGIEHHDAGTDHTGHGPGHHDPQSGHDDTWHG